MCWSSSIRSTTWRSIITITSNRSYSSNWDNEASKGRSITSSNLNNGGSKWISIRNWSINSISTWGSIFITTISWLLFICISTYDISTWGSILDCLQIWNFEFKKLAIAFSCPKSWFRRDVIPIFARYWVFDLRYSVRECL